MNEPTYQGQSLPQAFIDKLDPETRKELRLVGSAERVAVQLKREGMAEKKIQEQIGQYLRWRGIAFNVSRMDRAKTDKVGWPDITLALRPMAFPYAIAIAFEVKKRGKGPTDEQLACMADLKKSGWFVRVVYSVADVKIHLDNIARWNPYKEGTEP